MNISDENVKNDNALTNGDTIRYEVDDLNEDAPETDSEEDDVRGKQMFSGGERLVQPGKAAKKKKSSVNVMRIRLLTIAALLVLVIVGGLFGLRYINQVRAGEVEISAGVKSGIKNIAESTDIMQYAKAMKNDLKTVIESVKARDADAAEKAALELAGNGVDVVLSCLDAGGAGVAKAAKAKNIQMIGTAVDYAKEFDADDVTLASITYEWQKLAKMEASGQFEKGDEYIVKDIMECHVAMRLFARNRL